MQPSVKSTVPRSKKRPTRASSLFLAHHRRFDDTAVSSKLNKDSFSFIAASTLITEPVNRKEFDIWEKQQKVMYKMELDKLQNDLANRGLIFSGIRNEQEAHLKDRFDSEISIARIRMEEDAARKSSWFPDGNWRPFVLSSVTSVVIATAIFYLTDYIKSVGK